MVARRTLAIQNSNIQAIRCTTLFLYFFKPDFQTHYWVGLSCGLGRPVLRGLQPLNRVPTTTISFAVGTFGCCLLFPCTLQLSLPCWQKDDAHGTAAHSIHKQTKLRQMRQRLWPWDASGRLAITWNIRCALSTCCKATAFSERILFTTAVLHGVPNGLLRNSILVTSI